LTDYVRTLQYADEKIWIVLFDIDSQGQINRAHGVEFGNRILAGMIETMSDVNRVARWIGQCGDDTFFAICVGLEAEVGAYGRYTLSKISKRFSEGTAYVSATGGAINRRRMSSESAWIWAAGVKLREAQRISRGEFLMREVLPPKDYPVYHSDERGDFYERWPFS
jgi:GGDEF domain-containing protein